MLLPAPRSLKKGKEKKIWEFELKKGDADVCDNEG